jgi:hypothetical protein
MAQFAPPNPARAKRPKPVVLPHGTAHKTPASSQLIRLGLGAVKSVLGGASRKKKMSSGVRSTTRRRRSSSKGTSTGGSRRSRSKSSARLVKGSAAAKKYMAKIRKMKK